MTLVRVSCGLPLEADTGRVGRRQSALVVRCAHLPAREPAPPPIAYLMELDLYADVIVQRWENLTGKLAERIRAVAAAVSMRFSDLHQATSGPLTGGMPRVQLLVMNRSGRADADLLRERSGAGGARSAGASLAFWLNRQCRALPPPVRLPVSMRPLRVPRR